MAFEAVGELGATPSRGHVGYYLIGRGRPMLVQAPWCAGSREAAGLLDWVYQHHTPLYLGIHRRHDAVLPRCGSRPGCGGSGTDPPILFLMALVSLPATSQIAVQLVNYLCTRLLPPRLLPKMSFAKDGIPDEFRTLVVVPMLLVSEGNLPPRDRKARNPLSGQPGPQPHLWSLQRLRRRRYPPSGGR